mmetsp:Transcript_11199/g.23457  ORF Transcript_11199/g.23457 Transcript_11199/m.23457 type:complete len:242 (+) Transcript_11199:586-1311(+)
MEHHHADAGAKEQAHFESKPHGPGDAVQPVPERRLMRPRGLRAHALRRGGAPDAPGREQLVPSAPERVSVDAVRNQFVLHLVAGFGLGRRPRCLVALSIAGMLLDGQAKEVREEEEARERPYAHEPLAADRAGRDVTVADRGDGDDGEIAKLAEGHVHGPAEVDQAAEQVDRQPRVPEPLVDCVGLGHACGEAVGERHRNRSTDRTGGSAYSTVLVRPVPRRALSVESESGSGPEATPGSE